MFKRALKYVGAAALLLCPTLAGVVAATPAFATTYSNVTKVNAAHLSASFDTSHPTVDASADVLATFDATANPFGGIVDLPGSSVQRTGGSATMWISAIMHPDPNGSCTPAAGEPGMLRVEIRNAASNTQVGTDYWEPSSWAMMEYEGCNSEWASYGTVYFDNNPLDGDNSDGALAPGTYSIYMSIGAGVGSSGLAGMTTAGAHGNGPNDTEDTSIGTFTVTPAYQYLFGASAMGSTGTDKATDLADQQGSTTGISKNYSMARFFDSSWTSTPNADVRTWASQGKAVSWSVPPPGYTKHTSTTGGAWTNLSVSPWAAAAADTTTLNARVRALEDDANQTNGPSFMTWTVTHEPHDNTTDTSKGWDSGGSDAACGDPVTNHDYKHGVAGNVVAPSKNNDACFGSVAEYATLYNAMKTARDTQCDASGGITGTGHKCSKVEIAHIGVPSNMTPGTTVGASDLMNPSAFWGDIDVIGGDPYNYGCFRKTASNGNGTLDSGECSTANGWDSFQKTVDDPGAGTDSNGHHKTLLGLAELKDKPVILTEVGTHPGCNGTTETANGCNKTFTSMDRGTWFSDMYSFLQTSPLATRYLIGFEYFHVGPATSTYDWRFIPTSANPSPDTRGLSTYESTFGSDANVLTSAHSFVFNPTP